MHIVTERLLIRDFCASDAEDLHEILGDAETMKYCEPAYTFEQTYQTYVFYMSQKNRFDTKFLKNETVSIRNSE